MENSAVEWYKKATFEILKHKENLSDEIFLQNMLNAYLRAKEMEKQQISDAYDKGFNQGYFDPNFENETYKSE